MARKRAKFVKDRPPDQRRVDIDWRLFIAVPMPDHVQKLVGHLTEEFKRHDWPVRWSGAETAHLTLQFIGEVPPERAELLRLGLSAVVARHSAFTLIPSVLGVFPDFNQPRVLWLGLNGAIRQLDPLHRDLGKHLRSLDFEVDSRPIQAHITLGRVRDDPPRALGRQVQSTFNESEIGELIAAGRESFEVKEVVLVRSFLERAGARHEPVARFPLRPAS
jgi:2'-5' RNA ligase